MTDSFVDPTAGRFDPKELNGRLVLVTPLEYVEHITTKFNPDKDAVRADYVVLDGPEAPDAVEGALIFQGTIIGQIKGRIGKGQVLGRVGQGQPKPGMNPPWILEASTDEDKAIARQFLAGVSPV